MLPHVLRAHFQNASPSRPSCEGRAAHLHLCLAVCPQLEVEPTEAGRAGRGPALGSGSPPQTPGRAGPMRFRPCN